MATGRGRVCVLQGRGPAVLHLYTYTALSGLSFEGKKWQGIEYRGRRAEKGELGFDQNTLYLCVKLSIFKNYFYLDTLSFAFNSHLGFGVCSL